MHAVAPVGDLFDLSVLFRTRLEAPASPTQRLVEVVRVGIAGPPLQPGSGDAVRTPPKRCSARNASWPCCERRIRCRARPATRRQQERCTPPPRRTAPFSARAHGWYSTVSLRHADGRSHVGPFIPECFQHTVAQRPRPPPRSAPERRLSLVHSAHHSASSRSHTSPYTPPNSQRRARGLAHRHTSSLLRLHAHARVASTPRCREGLRCMHARTVVFGAFSQASPRLVGPSRHRFSSGDVGEAGRPKNGRRR